MRITTLSIFGALALLACKVFTAFTVVTQVVPLTSPTPSPVARPMPSPSSPSTPEHVARPTASALPAPAIAEEGGPPYERVFSIPVGDDGVHYRGLGIPETEVTGPNALAVLPDGTFVIGDLIENRLLFYGGDGVLVDAVDLDALGILNVSDLRADDEQIVLLEISFQVSPDRYRAHRLSLRGELVDSYDLPEGYHLEDGLTGVAIGEGRQILVEFEAGARVHQLVDAQGELNPSVLDGYTYAGRKLQLLGPIGRIGSVQVGTQLTLGLGGLSLLDARADGSLYLVRGDVVSDPTIVVDRTVHFFDSEVRQQGVARVPISERLYAVARDLAVGPDGAVYHLLPRPETLDVVRLNFFPRLDPLLPGAEEPVVRTYVPTE